ncbi:MAG: carbohydrate ABC transporter permease [Clostridiaceae bacterium]
MNKRNCIADAVKYMLLSIMAVAIILPIYLIVITAFKDGAEMSNSPIIALPGNLLNFDNFRRIISQGTIFRGYYNIAIILAVSLFGNILIGTTAAYALGRFEFKLKKIIMLLYTVSIIIPGTTTQVAIFGIIKNLHLVNTHFSVILLYLGTDIIQLYLYLQFIRSIPYALDESALIEGASYFKIYRLIILPMMVPAIVTVIILKTVSIYNDVYLPYLYMPAPGLAVVSTALMQFTSGYGSDYKLVSAATIFVILPTIVLYLFLQKYIFSGITNGAIKE